MIQIHMTGIDRVQRFIKDLPENLDREINNESGEFMKAVKKSAKLRAPRDTGRMAKSIVVFKEGKQWALEVESPYGLFQEEGFRPHAFLTDPGRPGFATNKLPLGQMVWVKKFTPFVKPALEHNLSKLAQRLSKATKRAIMGSK